MANNLDPFIPEVWSRMTQAYLNKTLVATQIASQEERSALKDWDTVHRPYKSRFSVSDYTKNTDVTATDITSTDETLIVNQSKVVSFKVDPVEDIQSRYNIASEFVPQAAYTLRNEIDASVLAEVSNAFKSLDAWDFWGTPWDAIDLWTYAPKRVWGAGYANLVANSVETDKGISTVIDPIMANEVMQDYINDWFKAADATLQNGLISENFLWMRVYVSNNLPASVTWTAAANFSADETVTVKWVTFTFKAAPAAAWEVDLWVDADTSLANLAAAINWGAWAWTAYIEVSAENRRTLTREKVVATAWTWVIDITSAWRMNPVETGAQFSFWTETVTAIVMQNWAIDLVMQSEVNTQRNKATNNLGSTFLTHTLYWIKTFEEGKQRMLALEIAA